MSTSDRIAYAAIILSLITFGWTIFRDFQLKKQSYRLDSELLKPELEVVDIDFEGKPIFDIAPIIDSSDKNRIPLIKTQFELHVVFYITNSSDNTCTLTAEIYNDSLSGIDFLRERILNKKEKRFKYSDNNTFFRIIEIKKNDTIKIEHTYKLRSIHDNSFTIHSLIFYQNEIGQLYDTYYWAKFKINDMIVSRHFDSISKKEILLVPKEQLDKLIELELDNNHSKSYDKKEKGKIINRIIGWQNAS